MLAFAYRSFFISFYQTLQMSKAKNGDKNDLIIIMI